VPVAAARSRRAIGLIGRVVLGLPVGWVGYGVRGWGVRASGGGREAGRWGVMGGMTLVDGEGAVLIADTENHMIRRYTPRDGMMRRVAGTGEPGAAGLGGPPEACQLNRPHGALTDPATGDIYVSDGYANARVHKYSPDGKLLFSWGEPGTDPGQFNLVHNIACDDEGWVYVADRENHRVQVFDSNGKYETQWHNLMRPCGLFITRGKEPIAVIGELGPETVASLTKGVPNLGPRLSVVSAKGEMLAHLGTEPIGEGLGQFIAPHGVALDSRGDIYVADWGNHRVCVFDSEGNPITSLIGDAQVLSKWGQQTVDANPDMAKARRRVKSLEPQYRFCFPTAVEFDPATDSVIVADSQRNRLQIYKKVRDYSDFQANL